MVFAAGDFCVSVSTLLVSLFCFIFKSLFGYSKPEFVEFKDCQDDEKENPKSFLKFQFPGYEEFNQSNGGNDDCVSFKVIGLYGSFRNAEIIDSEGDLMRRNSETEGSDEDEEPPDDSELNALAAIGEKIELYMGDSNPEELSLHADSNNSSFRNTEIIDVGRELYTQTLSINGEKAESAEGDTNTEELVKLQMSTDNRSGPEDDFLRNSSVQSSSSWDSHESNGLETLWEHQDLIEQLKMELKKVKATGLPTILEETQSPMEDLKPWKIEEKFQYEDRMDKLHNFYRSYTERMRKFDILNYQKMYAIGFLQSKESLESISSQKSSAVTLKSILSPNFQLRKNIKPDMEPMVKFMREIHNDMEMVYVGQLCLSWEILHCQYDKAIELWESDPHGILRFNEVAGSFQQLQVLMQRFLENEPFEAPRVLNYVNNRCDLRNLLQIPVIREDSLNDKKERKGKVKDAITSDKLVEMIEETIRIFWQFIRADKYAHNVLYKGRRAKNTVQLHDAADLELLTQVVTNLQKKEKKLKELLRSENCILKRFRKQNDGSDQALYFFSQVDIKLVCRVLNMSHITKDQLLWCSSKLGNISFMKKKICIQPSFVLFPC